MKKFGFFSYWPPIDNAIREAILRGVNVRILTAALHRPSVGLRFLKSLDALGGIPGSGAIQIVHILLFSRSIICALEDLQSSYTGKYSDRD